ncbi:MAG: hypothetical protein NZ903_03040 [Candidatus Micrarchaeota archaeon]|nr:hypothetical protein [Candidatus Micrarchaeota archaeon]
MVDNKIILIVLAIFCLIFVFGCIEKGVETGPVIKKNETKNKTLEEVNVSNGTNLTIPTKCEDLLVGKEKCIIERAYNNNNIEDCELLLEISPENKSYYVECVSKLSYYDYNYCSKLELPIADECYMAAAAKFGDSACNMINNSSVRKDCLLRDYKEECRKLNGTYERNVCNAVAQRNSSYCEKISSANQKDECYLNYSLTLSEDKCSKISNLGMRTACESLLTKNVQCGSLGDIYSKDYCYQYYAVYSSSCSWCNVIQTQTYKDDCYKRCVLIAKEMQFCNEISTEHKRDECYLEYSLLAKDVRGCNEIVLLMKKRFCVERVAKSNAMPSECETLLNTTAFSKRDVTNCYLIVIAESQVSFQNCIKMNDGYYRDLCIDMAIKRERLATDYCEYILDEALKNECKKQ